MLKIFSLTKTVTITPLMSLKGVFFTNFDNIYNINLQKCYN